MSTVEEGDKNSATLWLISRCKYKWIILMVIINKICFYHARFSPTLWSINSSQYGLLVLFKDYLHVNFWYWLIDLLSTGPHWRRQFRELSIYHVNIGKGDKNSATLRLISRCKYKWIILMVVINKICFYCIRFSPHVV